MSGFEDLRADLRRLPSTGWLFGVAAATVFAIIVGIMVLQ